MTFEQWGGRGAAAVLGLCVLVGCDADCPAVSQCDLRTRACQRSIMEAVACTRGGGGTELPKVTVIDEPQFLARIASEAEEDEEAQAEAEAAYRLWVRGLALFALAPADYDVDMARSDLASHVAAAYFPEQKDIVIIDRGVSLTSAGAVETFAHEVVHALQDAELDLLTYQSGEIDSFDAALALDAIIEGEAVHYQILAALQLAKRSPADLDWERLYTEWRSETLSEADTDEAPVAFASGRFPYAFGGGFVTQHWLANGRAGIDALFEHPPRTTSEVMFGAGDDDLEAERDALREHGVPVLPEPFEQVTTTALGAWTARMFAARMRASDRLEAARVLAADMFSVHHDPERDLVVAAWRARMRGDARPSSWPGFGRAEIGSLADDAQGEALLFAAEAGAPLPAELSELAWAAPAEEAESDEGTAAAAAAWRSRLRSGAMHGCNVRRFWP